ncbi:MAG: hypothetical protein ABFQ65_03370 [Nanoarchaeota archaeon]
MIKHKRGISTVVITIIMIVLVLAAIGVVWTIISSIIEDSSGEIGISSKCLKVNLIVTKMICADATCDITVNRKAGGENIGGFKLIFSNSVSGNVGTTVENVVGNIQELGTKTAEDKAHGLTDEQPDTVEVVVYFLSESGTEQICSQTKTFKF